MFCGVDISKMFCADFDCYLLENGVEYMILPTDTAHLLLKSGVNKIVSMLGPPSLES